MFLSIVLTVRRLAPVILPVALLLFTFGCTTAAVPLATGEWVTEQIKPLQDRLARLEANATAEKNRLDSTSAVANGAVKTANAAGQKADQVDGRLTRAIANRLRRTEVQQVEVTFETGNSALSQEARGTLQGIVKLLADYPTYTADVVGYTDSVGKADRNVGLSWQREEAVRRFLVERGTQLNRVYFIGVGEELAGDDAKDAAKREKNRRVAIVVFKPAE